jgi:hypothetical protein
MLRKICGTRRKQHSTVIVNLASHSHARTSLHSHKPKHIAKHCSAALRVMCSSTLPLQMQLVFAETTASWPPWRTAASMISKWLPASADDVPVLPRNSSSSSGNSSPDAAATAAAAAADWSCEGLGVVARTTSQLSSFNAAKRNVCGQHNSGSNVLLCGSLNSSSPLGVLAAAADADTPYTTKHSSAAFGAGVSCIVYSGVTPGSWAGKQSGYLGAASYWGSDADDFEEPGGVAIRTNSNSTRSGQEFCARSELAALQQQQQQAVPVARRSSGTGSSSHVRGLSPLDISRFNNSSSYCNSEGGFDLFPRSHSSTEQQKGRLDVLRRDAQGSRSATTKRRPGLLSQTSALSAAISGQSLPR